MNKNQNKQLMEIYTQLLEYYGPQHWWPGETPFEVIVGTILTQSAAWTNVEKAIIRLKKAGVMTPSAMQLLSQSDLAELVHSCGYYNMKAKKLLAFVEWLSLRFDGDLDRLFDRDLNRLRADLLEVYGIGEETADSILLYAGQKPIFVIDAYTRRIIDRVGLAVAGPRYQDYQHVFMDNLKQQVQLFNEYHALLVALGKNCCLKTEPNCQPCPLRLICRECTKAASLVNSGL
jgi:endonuclease III related protein